MKRPKYSLAYIRALQSYSKTVTESKLRKATNVTASHNEVKTAQEGTESYSPENVTIADCTIFQRVSSKAASLIHLIFAELQFNNALWYYDHTKNTRDAMAIKELREVGVLFMTEDTRIHYVNPDFIRKGNKLLVAANTAMVTAVGKVDRSMIRPLNKKNIELNPMHIVELG
jgi:hypothetical protein